MPVTNGGICAFYTVSPGKDLSGLDWSPCKFPKLRSFSFFPLPSFSRSIFERSVFSMSLIILIRPSLIATIKSDRWKIEKDSRESRLHGEPVVIVSSKLEHRSAFDDRLYKQRFISDDQEQRVVSRRNEADRISLPSFIFLYFVHVLCALTRNFTQCVYNVLIRLLCFVS